ncbi:transmembrane protein 183A isoform X2 [Aquarana catesbeiana]|uniref:transmembrane protein 183A isoform X2 n=1 Tax=Aquarana catesbeiana TaxID=8400 RepID=UPI003CC9572B
MAVVNTPQSVTVADYANSDPAVVKSGRIKKAVANAVQKEVKALCGLEASQVPTEDGLSILSENGQPYGSSDELEDSENLNDTCRKKKSKKHKETFLEDTTGGDYTIDIWLVLSNYIRPEDVLTFALICKKAWTVTCTAVFWMRLYKRHYRTSTYLPIRLLPECMYRLRSLRACVIRSFYHMYEPFSSRVAKNPTLPESTPSTLLNSKCLLFWCRKVTGNKPESLWDFYFKFKKPPLKQKNHCVNYLQPPTEYKEVHYNPDQDCLLLQITTLNFIFIPVVMGMTLAYVAGFLEKTIQAAHEALEQFLKRREGTSHNTPCCLLVFPPAQPRNDPTVRPNAPIGNQRVDICNMAFEDQSDVMTSLPV